MGIATPHEIIQVLDPFKEAMSHMEEENMVTFFPVIVGLEHSLKLFMDGKSLDLLLQLSKCTNDICQKEIASIS